jgi:rod shape-determining protein MreC
MAVPLTRSTPRFNRWWWLLGRLFLILLVILGVTLLLLNRTAPDLVRRWRAGATDILAPVMGAATRPVEATTDGTNWLGSYLNARDKAASLETEVKQLRARTEKHQQLVAENMQLKAILRVVEPNVRAVRTVRLVASSSASYVQSAVATAGSVHKIKVGQPVRDADGLIGQVVEVGTISSRILLVTDGQSRIPVLNYRSGQAGLVNGRNQSTMTLTLAEPGTPPQIGDQLITSGEGGVYPPGIPVGHVTAIVNDTPVITATAKLRNLNYGLVLHPYVPPAPPQPAAPQVDATETTPPAP